MVQFVAGLFCMVLGFFITTVVVGIDQTATLSTASFWQWLPCIIGVIVGVLIWFGGDADFDLFD